MKRFILTTGLIFGFIGQANAQSGLSTTSHCDRIIDSGLRETSISTNSRDYLNVVHKNYCSASTRESGFSFGSEINTIVETIPTTLKGNFGSSKEAMKNFCDNYDAQSYETTRAFDYVEKIVKRAYASYDTCIQMATSGVSASHAVRNRTEIDFQIAPGFARPVKIKAINTTPNMACHAINPETNEPIGSVGERTVVTLENSDTLNLFCTRSPEVMPNGDQVFSEGVVTIGTDIVPNGNYSATMAADTIYSQRTTDYFNARMNNIERKFKPIQLYKCPKDEFTNSGAWATVGCLGQVSSINECRNITYKVSPHIRQCEPLTLYQKN